ncbi:Mitochondrial inner membrane protein oxa1 [Ascosphaera aggregata]|nr:Mitochondrial inner membrane protein oxa1 [Ascosphaera aggregata]
MLSGFTARQSSSVAGLSGQRLRLLSRSQRQLSTLTLTRASQLKTVNAISRGKPTSRHLLRNGISQSRSISLWPFGKQQEQQTTETMATTTSRPNEEPVTAAYNTTDSATAPIPDASPSQQQSQSLSFSSDLASSTPDSIIDGTATASPSYSGVEAIDSIAESLPVGIDLTQLPEGLGYLHALGLDYGWGPSTIMEYLLESLHFTGGLPWWGAAIASSLLIRLVLFPATVGASDTSARLNMIKDDLKPLNDKMIEYYRTGEQVKALALRAKVSAIHAKNGVKTWKAFLPMLQIPFGFGVFRVMRGMSSLPVPGLEDESVAWLRDISVQDPYYILPVATGALLYFSMKKGGETGVSEIINSTTGKILRYGLPLSSAVFMAFWPGMLQLYFATSACWSLGQAYLLQNNRMRSMMRIAPLIKKPEITAEAPEQDVRQLRTFAMEKKMAAEKLKAQRETDITGLTTKLTANSGKAMDKARELVDRVKKRGSDGEQNADGKKTLKQRFTDTQLREAREWESKRAEEEETERESGNIRMKEEWERMQARQQELQRVAKKGTPRRRKD